MSDQTASSGTVAASESAMSDSQAAAESVIEITGLLSMQLKTQFASPRTQALPGFTAPHLTVAGLLVLAVLGPPALICWLRVGLSPVGPSSLALLIVALFAWQCWLMSNVLTLPLLTLWFGLMFGAQTDFVGGILGRWFLTPETTTVALLVFAVGAVALIALAVRVATVHEESPEYGLSIPADGFRTLTSRSASRDFDKMAGRMIARSKFAPWALDRWFEALMKHLPARGRFRRIALYQIVHGYGLLIVMPLFCIGFALIAGIVPTNDFSRNLAVIFPALFLPHFVLAVAGAIWLQHGKWHATELLRPQSRQEFVRGLFYGIGGDVSWAGGWVLLAQIVAWSQGATAFGRTPSETILTSMTLVVGYILISASTLMMVLSYQNFWVYLGAMTAVFVVQGGVWAGFIALELDRSAFGLAGLLAMSVLVATVVLRKARDRWMNLELA
jgi:hypothetical protein